MSKLFENYGKHFDFSKDADWVIDTEDMPLAHIKELFIAVKILGYDYLATIGRLKADLVENDADGSGVFGDKQD